MIIISAISLIPAILHAKEAHKVKKYTVYRDRTLEVASPPRETKLQEIKISEHNGIYRIKLIATLNTSARHVRHVLTDFLHLYRLNPSIIESKVVERHNDHSISVKTRVIGCAAYFCEELNRVERARELPSGDLFAEIVAEQSQFRSGHTLWQIRSQDERSVVSYTAEMGPDIFIPPVVGKFLIKKSIREEVKIVLTNLEKISNVVAEKEWRENYQPEYTEFAYKIPRIDYARSSVRAGTIHD